MVGAPSPPPPGAHGSPQGPLSLARGVPQTAMWQGGVTSSGESVHFHRPQSCAQVGVYITRSPDVYIQDVYVAGRGKVLVTSTDRSCMPKAAGIPADVSWQPLTQEPPIPITP